MKRWLFVSLKAVWAFLWTITDGVTNFSSSVSWHHHAANRRKKFLSDIAPPSIPKSYSIISPISSCSVVISLHESSVFIDIIKYLIFCRTNWLICIGNMPGINIKVSVIQKVFRIRRVKLMCLFTMWEKRMCSYATFIADPLILRLQRSKSLWALYTSLRTPARPFILFRSCVKGLDWSTFWGLVCW